MRLCGQSDSPNIYLDNAGQAVVIGRNGTSYVSPCCLHLAKNSGVTTQLVFECTGSATSAIALSTSTFTIGAENKDITFRTGCSYNGDFTSTGTERMRILQGGNVGIGNSSPSATLDIRGGSISLGSFDTSSGSKYVGFYNVNDSNGCLVGMEIENTTLGGNYSQKLHLRTHLYGGNNGRRLTISENGDVSITKNLTTGNPYWFITHSSGGNATYTSGGGSWFSSTANGTFYGNSITTGGSASSSAFNTTSGTFTFPVAGTYLISVPMFINGATGGRYAIAIFGSSIKPVSQYFEFTSTNLPANEMRTWTFVKQVNANDTMYLSTEYGSITLYLAETHSTLNIFKVG